MSQIFSTLFSIHPHLFTNLLTSSQPLLIASTSSHFFSSLLTRLKILSNSFSLLLNLSQLFPTLITFSHRSTLPIISSSFLLTSSHHFQPLLNSLLNFLLNSSHLVSSHFTFTQCGIELISLHLASSVTNSDFLLDSAAEPALRTT